jgi:hypothetical protein
MSEEMLPYQAAAGWYTSICQECLQVSLSRAATSKKSATWFADFWHDHRQKSSKISCERLLTDVMSNRKIYLPVFPVAHLFPVVRIVYYVKKKKYEKIPIQTAALLR